MSSLIHTYTSPQNISSSIFRAYDIRGIVDHTLTVDLVYAIGLAIGTEAKLRGQTQMVIGRDGRLSSPALISALAEGLQQTGMDVIDIGMAPTPLLYFATHWFETYSGIMLTGSHNPGNYNGLKIVLNGSTLMEGEIQQLYQRVRKQDFIFAPGSLSERDLNAEYIERIARDVKLHKPMKIVVDAGNGVTGNIAPRLFTRLGCEVIPLFCDIDGRFPHHHPDPSEASNLKDLQQAVLQHQADVGLAFDGDGDRLGIVTDQGEIIWADRQLMILARDVLSRHPGAEIIFDVKCTRHLAEVIAAAGGKPLMWKTGHSLIKSKMRESAAPLAGEMSGHIFFKERWYGFDDGLYSGARLLEILSREKKTCSEVFKAFPDSINTPEIKVAIADEHKQEFMQQIIKLAHFDNATINTIDGLRVDFADGWGLVRASNTSPNLTLRFEADNEAALVHIQTLFRKLLLKIDNTLQIEW